MVLLENRNGRRAEHSTLVFAVQKARKALASIELKRKSVRTRCCDIFGCNHRSGHNV